MRKTLKAALVVVSVCSIILPGIALYIYVHDLITDNEHMAQQLDEKSEELKEIRSQWFKINEYDSVYARMDRGVEKGFLPDTLVLWSIRRAWNEYGLQDSIGLSWVTIESSMGMNDSNWLGEKGVFFLQENFLRDLVLRMGGDTIGFVFHNYQHPYMQSKWAAFTELAIRIKLGRRGSYWAYNTGALMWGRSDFDKFADEAVKWKAAQKLYKKKGKSK